MHLLVNGTNYYYERKGNGPHLLLLHGFSGSQEDWHPLAENLSSHYSLLMVDLLGHGRSGHPDDTSKYEIEQGTKDLAAILQELAISQTHLLGYSMGGRLALAFTLKYPHLVSSLILVSSSPGIEDKNMRAARVTADEALAGMIEKRGIEEFVAYWDTLPLFQNDSSSPDPGQAKARLKRLSNNPLGLANSLKGMGTGRQPSFWEHLTQLKIPVLLITGEKDFKYCEIADKMLKLLHIGKKETVPASGHRVYLDQPERFHQLVKNFLP